MLKCETCRVTVNESETIRCDVSADGSLVDICGEAAAILRSIYKNIYRHDIESAELFRGFIVETANEDFFWEISSDELCGTPEAE